MIDTPRYDSDLVSAHTTAATASVARWVAQHHGFPVQQCHLIRRGLNDNYALRAADGTRYVASLYSIRPRGGFNIDFEVALLAHLEAKGVGVATPVSTKDGRAHIQLQFPEGPRALALFHHANGATPETLDEFELTGRALAHIHEAARDYSGPPGRYAIDGHHLAGRTLVYLKEHPELDAELFETYRRLVHHLLEELAVAEGGLTRVICHGDTHGFNNHVSTNGGGTKKTVFFDFDDAGPGFLAYDLSVLPWSYLVRKSLKEPDDALRELWTQYLRGYRAGGCEVSEHDLAALPLFIQLRHLGTLAKQPCGYITGGRIRCLRIGCESRSKYSRRGKRWTYAPDDMSVSRPLPGSAEYKQFVSDLGPAFDRRFVAKPRSWHWTRGIRSKSILSAKA